MGVAVRYMVFQLNPFWVQLVYFMAISLIGYFVLKLSNPRSSSPSWPPSDLDVFFTSVSATTVSSMSTVEMEVFSNIQLVIITVLMFLGGEVFVSVLQILFKLAYTSGNFPPAAEKNADQYDNYCVELDLVSCSHPIQNQFDHQAAENDGLKYNSTKFLAYIVLGYLLAVHILGFNSVFMYMSLVPSARRVLKTKSISLLTFSVFVIVSTFANCGFVPTNENMIVFRSNPGLLWLLMPQVLLGNTLYPVSLRVVIWVLEKTMKRVELSYILREMDYEYLLSGWRCCLLGLTIGGFVLVQLIVFLAMEWNSLGLEGLSPYQKVVASLFQVMNSRHAGESIVDLSTIAPAILVIFIVMMYLPPSTIYLPTCDYKKKKKEATSSQNGKGRSILKSLMLSELSYLTIFIILVCITERESMKEDPINFSVLNITLEIISAYGNVGFSTGYSCGRQLKHDETCKDRWCGLVGRWSDGGRFVLILVMFFGRLKKFHFNGGQAWKLY